PWSVTGKYRQLAHFQGLLRITLNDVFRSPENVQGKKFLTSLATMVSILQVSIFGCLTELCHFWCLVEVPRSQGCRGFVFDRTYGEGTVKALTHLVSEVNRIGMALVEFHPDRLVEIMVPIFELYRHGEPVI
ncbi:hypothetical protein MRX96_050525, partial [Rhipicephalus microplus]